MHDPRYAHCPDCAGGRVNCPTCDGEGIVEAAPVWLVVIDSGGGPRNTDWETERDAWTFAGMEGVGVSARVLAIQRRDPDGTLTTLAPSGVADLAAEAAYTTPWSRDQWRHALDSLRVEHRGNRDVVANIGKLAGAYGTTPLSAARTLYPDV